MDKLQTTMVHACDRLLLLLTGPRAITDPVAIAAAEEAIQLLQKLESHFQGASAHLPIGEDILENLMYRTEVLNHVGEVLAVLRELKLCA